MGGMVPSHPDRVSPDPYLSVLDINFLTAETYHNRQKFDKCFRLTMASELAMKGALALCSNILPFP